MSLVQLALLVFYFNAITFGNGPMMVPLLQERLVEGLRVLTIDQLLYAFAISRVIPGQANVYVASVGFFLFGLPGAILSTLAIQLPGYAMLPLEALHRRFRGVTAVQYFIRGLTATSVGLIFAATLAIGRNTLVTPVAGAVFLVSVMLAYTLKWSPLLSLAVATALGLTLQVLLA